MIKKLVLLCGLLVNSQTLRAYTFEKDHYYISGGTGAMVTVSGFEGARQTPGAFLPMLIAVDYSIEKDIAVFASAIPQFGASALSLMLQIGGKYRFNFANTPYVPYVGLAFSPAFLVPMTSAKNHINLGLSPSVGINYFVLSDFLVGLHMNFHPSMAWSDGQSKGEFAVSGIFDVSFRI